VATATAPAGAWLALGGAVAELPGTEEDGKACDEATDETGGDDPEPGGGDPEPIGPQAARAASNPTPMTTDRGTSATRIDWDD